MKFKVLEAFGSYGVSTLCCIENVCTTYAWAYGNEGRMEFI